MQRYFPKDRYPNLRRNSAVFLHSQTGNRVAKVETDLAGRTYAIKRIDPARHVLRRPPGIAIDLAALEDARRLGVAYVRVGFTTGSTVLCATLDQFDRDGIDLDRGYGAQRVLPIEKWHRAPEPRDPAPVPILAIVQGGLFDDIARAA